MSKQQQKMSRVNHLWNLIPFVNEDLLDHNLKTECGLSKLWEDYRSDYQMREMRVSECGLLTH